MIKRIISRKGIYNGIELWNRLNPTFKISPRLLEQNIFAPFTGVNSIAWGEFSANELVGFGLAKYLTKSITDYTDISLGWISLFVVDQEKNDSEGIAKGLLKRMEEDLNKKGVKRIRFGGDPQNYLPGLPVELSSDYVPILKKFGFKEGSREFDLYRDISDFKLPARIEAIEKQFGKELVARSVTKEEEGFLMNFLKRTFPGRWLYEAENISRIPGGIEDYWLLWYLEKPVGFIRINTSDSVYLGPNVNWGSQWGESYCGFGPLGMDKNYRGKGWGLYLITMVIKYLQKEGYHHMMIDWTGLVDYYRKLGFKPWKEYISFYKEIE